MIFKIFTTLAVLLMVSGCVPDNKFGSSSATSANGTTNGTTTTSYGASSCTEIAGYTTLAGCKTVTYAQCFSTASQIQGAVSICYFPVTGWQACNPTSATWVYDPYSAWCRSSTGVFTRTRTSTCQRSNAACDCATDAINSETCTTNSTAGYSACSLTNNGVGLYDCGTTTAVTPTPVPTPNCAQAVINYNVTTASNSADALQTVRTNRQVNIVQNFASKGYTITKFRGSNVSLAPTGTQAGDLSYNYYFQVEASWVSSCAYGRNVSVKIYYYKGGVYKKTGTASITCVPNGTGLELATDNALMNLAMPYCGT